MAIARLNGATPATTIETLPITLEQQTSRASLLIASAFIMLTATLLLAPFSLVAASAVYDPAPLISALRRPVVAVQLSLALVVAIAFVTVPLRLLLRRSRRPRRIVVSAAGVIASNGPGGNPAWNESLAAYRGVAHHIRTSLSGAQHEIVLVHPQSARSVVLHSADRIDQAEVDAVARLLNLSEVPARTLYQVRRPRTVPMQLTGALKAA